MPSAAQNHLKPNENTATLAKPKNGCEDLLDECIFDKHMSYVSCLAIIGWRLKHTTSAVASQCQAVEPAMTHAYRPLKGV